MIKLSNGIEISEETVINALEKVGIKTAEPPYIFKAGDVAKNSNGYWRFIITYHGVLYSVNTFGGVCGNSQQYFEENGYEYVDRQEDIIK